MNIQRALKVRIYPTPEQQAFLNKTLGSCRFLYNQMLNERIETYNELKNNKEALYTHQYKTEKDYKAYMIKVKRGTLYLTGYGGWCRLLAIVRER